MPNIIAMLEEEEAEALEWKRRIMREQTISRVQTVVQRILGRKDAREEIAAAVGYPVGHVGASCSGWHTDVYITFIHPRDPLTRILVEMPISVSLPEDRL
jgi:lysozyme family protein